MESQIAPAENQTPGAGARWPSVPCLIFLLGIVAVGTLLRCNQLAEISYWFDESFCWKMTTFEWSELWGRVARDNHPPLYFFLLKLWTLCWGESAVAMRSLSVICGGAVIVGGYLLAREVDSGAGKSALAADVAGLLAAACLALAPFQIEWSTQVRMYALGSALTLWSSWILLRALRHPDSHSGLWFGYGIMASALAYTHYYGLFILLAQFLFATGDRLYRKVWKTADPPSRAALLPVLITFVLVGMSWSPWLPEFLAHRQQVTDSFWTKPLTATDVTWTCVRIWTGVWSDRPIDEKISWWVAGVTLTIWVGQLLFGRGGLRLLALGPLVTFVATVAASLSSRNILSARYFVFAHALAVCGVAVCIQRLPGVWLRGLTGGLVLVGLGFLCVENVQRRDRWATRPGFESAVAYLDEVRKPGEPVLVGNPMVQINVAAYVGDRDTVYVLSDNPRFPYFQGTAVMRDTEYLSNEAVSSFATDRIWLIETKNWTGGSIAVSLPSPWVDIREESFYDWHSRNCEIIVKECVRRRSAVSPPTVNKATQIPRDPVLH
ncbi:MAG: glycosyltransferase family 39 protein [Planctomycetes bacterium]|nr:glycosyltransferase family 39 protein [Planctomycetota bacterium]